MVAVSSPLPDLGDAARLVAKYNIPGPRYTSYPTAPQFIGQIDPRLLLDDLRRDNADASRPLSLYFHLPFCETRCWFCGCTTVITRRRAAAGEYIDLLAQELALAAPRLNRARPVVQLHFGGGTPTFLPPAEISRLGDLIHQHFDFAPDAENSVEIDPRRLTREHIVAFRGLGCNRASLGVQDTNPGVQLAVNRWQPFPQTQQAVEWLREQGFSSISLDLIYGLPLQTPESFACTLRDALWLRPDRLSVFSYAHVPWLKPVQKIFDQRGVLPSADAKLAMLLTAIHTLTAAGYGHIGMDHFAQAGDDLTRALLDGTLHRNFQGYSAKAGASLYGFGLSSISQTDGAYRQNFKELDAYAEAVAAGRLPVERGLILTEEDRRRRAIIMDIMCRGRLDYADLSRRLGVDFAKAYAVELASLADLEADGLVESREDGIDVTPLGRLFLRIIAMRFDAYLGAKSHGFSRTV